MNRQSPILAVDDDEDDLMLLKEAYDSFNLPNELILLRSGDELVEYLQSAKERPLLVICDYNLPKMNGLEIRRKMLEDPNTHYRSIPFVLLSTAMSKTQIRNGFDQEVQGFFVKPGSFSQLKLILSSIINYWQFSERPEAE